MHLTSLDFVLWASGFVGHLSLLAVLWLRRHLMQYPWFSSLIFCNVVKTVILYGIYRYGTDQTYALWYWVLTLLSVVLGFGVLYEVAFGVFRPAGTWAPDVQRIGMVLTGSAVVLAALVTWLAIPVSPNWRQLVTSKGTFFCAVLTSELCVGMVTLSFTVGLPWKTPAARIAQGLGTYSLFEVLIEAAHTLPRSMPAWPSSAVLSWCRMAIYLGCLLYWIITLWQEEPEPRQLPFWMEQMLPRFELQTRGQLANLRRMEK